ncbi:competence protein F, putative [Thermosinus carboxydivorans Nor1]|uniref:Competence protein F, putative n=1 Tax=Thermosinus carboxydivorans Nor1 TaxID=401526 RepID=A1HT62_9FIRM|nr:phosphoribosyltransferase family protein [Thermosinus carboxydivorans]EAX46824.1 competence protein F, putative [Thermosinus carboxydivorans Nor1]
MLNAWRRALLDLIYPPKCPACRAGVTEHGAWCQPCLAAVAGARLINVAEHRLKYLDACYAACDYAAGVQKIIRRLKFQRAERYARHLAWLVARSGAGEYSRGSQAVVPVPLDAARQKERGFNQTELIFREWAANQGLVWLDVLVRCRPTAPQWRLTVSERRQNIKGAFYVTRPELVAGKTLLLVDDIFTTGVTMEECARVLKAAGAKRVAGLAVASGAV